MKRGIKRSIVGLVWLVVGAGAATAQTAAVTTVIVVRHAERAAEPANDPVLTPGGEARAKALLDAVRDAGISAIITTQLQRTRLTAQPTAAALGLSPSVVATSGATHVQDVASAVKKQGGTVLVVGHSNTVPAIVAALGAKQPRAICDSEYDNLFVVTIVGEKASVIRSKYGEPSRLDATCATMR